MGLEQNGDRISSPFMLLQSHFLVFRPPAAGASAPSSCQLPRTCAWVAGRDASAPRPSTLRLHGVPSALIILFGLG